MLLKLVWILIMFGGKYHQENAKNGISDHLDFEILWGSMPPDPPKSLHLQHFCTCLGYQKSLAMALKSTSKLSCTCVTGSQPGGPQFPDTCGIQIHDRFTPCTFLDCH